MIIVEQRLGELFDTIPVVTVSGADYKPIYDFGSHKDLLRFLAAKRKEGGNIYPLIWLETPITETGDNSPVFVNLKLVLATLTSSTLSNTERLEKTFKPTLFPLLKNVEKSLKVSGFSRIMNPDKNKVSKFYNFEDKGENNATDIWDAIKFECELRVTDCPQQKFNY